MENFFNNLLEDIKKFIEEGLTTKTTHQTLSLIGISNYPENALKDTKLYSEFLPIAIETPFTEEQRYLHFLWEVFDKSPYSLCVSFAIPFRQIIAKKLFRKCGKNFISEAGVLFNLGHHLEIGDNVFFNRGVYIDSKGIVKIGNSVALTENVKIFTHTHSESDHALRHYDQVTIKDFAKIYTGVTILPGVTIGKHSLVAAGAIVTKSIPDNCLAGGIPAKVLRERSREGKTEEELNHIWLGNGAFQL